MKREVVFPSVESDDEAFWPPAAAGLFVAGSAMLLSPLFPAGSFPIVAFVALLVALFGFQRGLVAVDSKKSVAFTSDGVWLRGAARHKQLHGTTLNLEGEPGRGQALYLEDTLLARFDDHPYAEVSELAGRAAALAGLKLEDTRDARWFQIWDEIPERRIEVTFALVAKRSHAAFPDNHFVREELPIISGTLEQVEWRLDVSDTEEITPIVVTPNAVRYWTRVARLESIYDAQVVFGGPGGSAATLQLRLDDRIVDLATAPTAETRQVGRLKWIAKELVRLARDARARETGSHADIPEAIKKIARTRES